MKIPTVTRQVYAIYDEDSNLVKIGFSGVPTHRLYQLRIGRIRNLFLLATAPGGRTREAAIHRELATDRIRGEWFKQSPRLWATVHSMRLEQAEDEATHTQNKRHQKELRKQRGLPPARDDLESGPLSYMAGYGQREA